MPDWTLYDPQLRQWSAEGVKPDEIAKRLNLKRQTVRDRPIKLGLFVPEPKTKKSPHQEMTRPHETVEVLSGHLSTDEDTAGEVHDGAVHEFDRLPDGYAKEIQPMRPYSDAEEFALNESMRLFGFVGAIVRDQYGRILDGHHRQRVARLRGLGVPYTITQVRDDAHAVAVATSLNAVRRQYPREEREQIAIAMRDQGFSYRVIAAALGVSKDTVQRDIFGGFKIIPAPEPEVAGVSSETPARMLTESPVSSETAQSVMDNPPVSHETPARRIRGRDQKSYPAQRPTTQKAPKRSDSDDSTRADQWYNRLAREFNHLDRIIKQFQSEGGVSVLGRQLSPDMRASLLGDLRGKAKMLREMADYLETITRPPTDTSEMFDSSPISEALDSPEEKEG
jgi:hypothetical protein